ncbi:unnamed protein product [Amoebophrya sp. A120]|nr:unnamed protein product [Amoebophrya sp. A120]|eukprot:GSA120T00000622001.1
MPLIAYSTEYTVDYGRAQQAGAAVLGNAAIAPVADKFRAGYDKVMNAISGAVCSNQDQLLADPVIRSTWLQSGLDPNMQMTDSAANGICGPAPHIDEHMARSLSIPRECKNYVVLRAQAGEYAKSSMMADPVTVDEERDSAEQAAEQELEQKEGHDAKHGSAAGDDSTSVGAAGAAEGGGAGTDGVKQDAPATGAGTDGAAQTSELELSRVSKVRGTGGGSTSLLSSGGGREQDGDGFYAVKTSGSTDEARRSTSSFADGGDSGKNPDEMKNGDTGGGDGNDENQKQTAEQEKPQQEQQLDHDHVENQQKNEKQQHAAAVLEEEAKEQEISVTDGQVAEEERQAEESLKAENTQDEKPPTIEEMYEHDVPPNVKQQLLDELVNMRAFVAQEKLAGYEYRKLESLEKLFRRNDEFSVLSKPKNFDAFYEDLKSKFGEESTEPQFTVKVPGLGFDPGFKMPEISVQQPDWLLQITAPALAALKLQVDLQPPEFYDFMLDTFGIDMKLMKLNIDGLQLALTPPLTFGKLQAWVDGLEAPGVPGLKAPGVHMPTLENFLPALKNYFGGLEKLLDINLLFENPLEYLKALSLPEDLLPSLEKFKMNMGETTDLLNQDFAGGSGALQSAAGSASQGISSALGGQMGAMFVELARTRNLPMGGSGGNTVFLKEMQYQDIVLGRQHKNLRHGSLVAVPEDEVLQQSPGTTTTSFAGRGAAAASSGTSTVSVSSLTLPKKTGTATNQDRSREHHDSASSHKGEPLTKPKHYDHHHRARHPPPGLVHNRARFIRPHSYSIPGKQLVELAQRRRTKHDDAASQSGNKMSAPGTSFDDQGSTDKQKEQAPAAARVDPKTLTDEQLEAMFAKTEAQQKLDEEIAAAEASAKQHELEYGEAKRYMQCLGAMFKEEKPDNVTPFLTAVKAKPYLNGEKCGPIHLRDQKELEQFARKHTERLIRAYRPLYVRCRKHQNVEDKVGEREFPESYNRNWERFTRTDEEKEALKKQAQDKAVESLERTEERDLLLDGEEDFVQPVDGEPDRLTDNFSLLAKEVKKCEESGMLDPSSAVQKKAVQRLVTGANNMVGIGGHKKDCLELYGKFTEAVRLRETMPGNPSLHDADSFFSDQERENAQVLVSRDKEGRWVKAPAGEFPEFQDTDDAVDHFSRVSGDFVEIRNPDTDIARIPAACASADEPYDFEFWISQPKGRSIDWPVHQEQIQAERDETLDFGMQQFKKFEKATEPIEDKAKESLKLLDKEAKMNMGQKILDRYQYEYEKEVGELSSGATNSSTGTTNQGPLCEDEFLPYNGDRDPEIDDGFQHCPNPDRPFVLPGEQARCADPAECGPGDQSVCCGPKSALDLFAEKTQFEKLMQDEDVPTEEFAEEVRRFAGRHPMWLAKVEETEPPDVASVPVVNGKPDISETVQKMDGILLNVKEKRIEVEEMRKHDIDNLIGDRDRPPDLTTADKHAKYHSFRRKFEHAFARAQFTAKDVLWKLEDNPPPPPEVDDVEKGEDVDDALIGNEGDNDADDDAGDDADAADGAAGDSVEGGDEGADAGGDENEPGGEQEPGGAATSALQISMSKGKEQATHDGAADFFGKRKITITERGGPVAGNMPGLDQVQKTTTNFADDTTSTGDVKDDDAAGAAAGGDDANSTGTTDDANGTADDGDADAATTSANGQEQQAAVKNAVDDAKSKPPFQFVNLRKIHHLEIQNSQCKAGKYFLHCAPRDMEKNRNEYKCKFLYRSPLPSNEEKSHRTYEYPPKPGVICNDFHTEKDCPGLTCEWDGKNQRCGTRCGRLFGSRKHLCTRVRGCQWNERMEKCQNVCTRASGPETCSAEACTFDEAQNVCRDACHTFPDEEHCGKQLQSSHCHWDPQVNGVGACVDKEGCQSPPQPDFCRENCGCWATRVEGAKQWENTCGNLITKEIQVKRFINADPEYVKKMKKIHGENWTAPTDWELLRDVAKQIKHQHPVCTCQHCGGKYHDGYTFSHKGHFEHGFLFGRVDKEADCAGHCDGDTGGNLHCVGFTFDPKNHWCYLYANKIEVLGRNKPHEIAADVDAGAGAPGAGADDNGAAGGAAQQEGEQEGGIHKEQGGAGDGTNNTSTEQGGDGGGAAPPAGGDNNAADEGQNQEKGATGGKKNNDGDTSSSQLEIGRAREVTAFAADGDGGSETKNGGDDDKNATKDEIDEKPAGAVAGGANAGDDEIDEKPAPAVVQPPSGSNLEHFLNEYEDEMDDVVGSETSGPPRTFLKCAPRFCDVKHHDDRYGVAGGLCRCPGSGQYHWVGDAKTFCGTQPQKQPKWTQRFEIDHEPAEDGEQNKDTEGNEEKPPKEPKVDTCIGGQTLGDTCHLLTPGDKPRKWSGNAVTCSASKKFEWEKAFVGVAGQPNRKPWVDPEVVETIGKQETKPAILKRVCPTCAPPYREIFLRVHDPTLRGDKFAPLWRGISGDTTTGDEKRYLNHDNWNGKGGNWNVSLFSTMKDAMACQRDENVRELPAPDAVFGDWKPCPGSWQFGDAMDGEEKFPWGVAPSEGEQKVMKAVKVKVVEAAKVAEKEAKLAAMTNSSELELGREKVVDVHAFEDKTSTAFEDNLFQDDAGLLQASSAEGSSGGAATGTAGEDEQGHQAAPAEEPTHDSPEPAPAEVPGNPAGDENPIYADPDSVTIEEQAERLGLTKDSDVTWFIYRGPPTKEEDLEPAGNDCEIFWNSNLGRWHMARTSALDKAMYVSPPATHVAPDKRALLFPVNANLIVKPPGGEDMEEQREAQAGAGAAAADGGGANNDQDGVDVDNDGDKENNILGDDASDATSQLEVGREILMNYKSKSSRRAAGGPGSRRTRQEQPHLFNEDGFLDGDTGIFANDALYDNPGSSILQAAISAKKAKDKQRKGDMLAAALAPELLQPWRRAKRNTKKRAFYERLGEYLFPHRNTEEDEPTSFQQQEPPSAGSQHKMMKTSTFFGGNLSTSSTDDHHLLTQPPRKLKMKFMTKNQIAQEKQLASFLASTTTTSFEGSLGGMAPVDLVKGDTEKVHLSDAIPDKIDLDMNVDIGSLVKNPLSVVNDVAGLGAKSAYAAMTYGGLHAKDAFAYLANVASDNVAAGYALMGKPGYGVRSGEEMNLWKKTRSDIPSMVEQNNPVSVILKPEEEYMADVSADEETDLLVAAQRQIEQDQAAAHAQEVEDGDFAGDGDVPEILPKEPGETDPAIEGATNNPDDENLLADGPELENPSPELLAAHIRVQKVKQLTEQQAKQIRSRRINLTKDPETVPTEEAYNECSLDIAKALNLQTNEQHATTLLAMGQPEAAKKWTDRDPSMALRAYKRLQETLNPAFGTAFEAASTASQAGKAKAGSAYTKARDLAKPLLGPTPAEKAAMEQEAFTAAKERYLRDELEKLEKLEGGGDGSSGGAGSSADEGKEEGNANAPGEVDATDEGQKGYLDRLKSYFSGGGGGDDVSSASASSEDTGSSKPSAGDEVAQKHA